MRQRDKRVVIPLTLTSLGLARRSRHTFSDAADAPRTVPRPTPARCPPLLAIAPRGRR